MENVKVATKTVRVVKLGIENDIPELEYDSEISVADALEQAGIDVPDGYLVMVNARIIDDLDEEMVNTENAVIAVVPAINGG